MSTHDQWGPSGSGADPQVPPPPGGPGAPAPAAPGTPSADTTPLQQPAPSPTREQPPFWGPPQQAPSGYPGYAPPHGGPAGYVLPPGSDRPYGSFPSTSGAYPGVPGADRPAPRRAGRVRIGMAGLVAGALIGGGAGAGTAVLLDESVTPTASGASAQSVVIENPETATTATAAAAKAAPSVVTIYVANGSGSGSGSGVVLTEDGYVLTNNHVVTMDGNEAGTVQVRTTDGTLYDATVVGTDPSSDLAVVNIDGVDGLTPATFADSDEVQVGDVAVAIGAPLGLSNTVTDGIISATGRAVATGSTENDATVIDAIQTDAAINPGNSGGALVNGAGEVIGINTAIATVASGMPGGQSESGNIGVGFAIPSNTAERIAREIIETGSATRAFLGVSARTEPAEGNSGIGNGASIVSVEPGTGAEDAGLRPGDVVVAVGDRPVTTSTELTAAVRSHSPGETVTLTVRRDGDTRTVEVTLGSTG